LVDFWRSSSWNRWECFFPPQSIEFPGSNLLSETLCQGGAFSFYQFQIKGSVSNLVEIVAHVLASASWRCKIKIVCRNYPSLPGADYPLESWLGLGAPLNPSLYGLVV
jgi:hypothetical protein